MASIDVLAPLRAVFDHWTAFERLPQVIPAFDAVRVEAPDRLRVRLAGSGEAFPAEVTEEHLDERVAWRSLDGPHHAGVVTLRPLGDAVQVDLELEGPLGDPAEVLERFKALAEAEPPPPGRHADILHPGATRGLGDDASTIRG
jgi:uncharacterized membrane protein